MVLAAEGPLQPEADGVVIHFVIQFGTAQHGLGSASHYLRQWLPMEMVPTVTAVAGAGGTG